MPKLTYNDMLSAYSHYPAPIRPFLLRAETHPQIRSCTSKSFMRVLVDLISRVSIAHPEKPIKVKVEVIAKDLGVTTRTVSRAISFCLNSSWLAPDPLHDGRNRWGKFAAKQYLVTENLRELVGLPTMDYELGDVSESQHDGKSFRSKNNGLANTGAKCKGDGIAKTDAESEESKVAIFHAGIETKMSSGIGVNNCSSLKEASFNEAEKPKNLSADLAAMQNALGIELFGIFSLMRLAKAVGQRLQDVWHVKRQLLTSSGITGGRAVHYIRALLNSGDDFSYIARTRFPGNSGSHLPSSDSAIPSHESAALKSVQGCGSDLHALARTCRFKKFKHVRTDMFVRFYDGVAEVTRGLTRETYAGQEMMRGLYVGVAAGNLREVNE